MEQQTSAERKRRAMILEAQGERRSAVETAEGDKQSNIIRAQGEKQSQILEAQGDAISTVLRAKSAEAMGERAIIDKGMETLEGIGQSEVDDVRPPQEVTSLVGRYGKHLTGSDTKENGHVPKGWSSTRSPARCSASTTSKRSSVRSTPRRTSTSRRWSRRPRPSNTARIPNDLRRRRGHRGDGPGVQRRRRVARLGRELILVEAVLQFPRHTNVAMGRDGDVDESKRATLRRFAALGAASPLVRLRERRGSRSDARDAIAGYLSTTPGAHFSKIRDDLQPGTGETQHHLRELVENGVIESEKGRRLPPVLPR